MRVIAEFVDRRNGKRYLPGSGDGIDPALTDEQVAGLKASGCIQDGDDGAPDHRAAAAAALDPLPTDKDMRKMSAAQLVALAGRRGVDLGGKAKASEIVAILQASVVDQPAALPPEAELQAMDLDALIALGTERGIDMSAAKTAEEAIGVLQAPAA